jgi:multiple sugar transport system ATP-binding protein
MYGPTDVYTGRGYSEEALPSNGAAELIRDRGIGDRLRVGEIVLDGVTKEFGAGVVAVDDVSLTIEDGEFMVLVGPSGCGKTTLLRSIGGLEDVTAGRILIDQRDVTNVAPARRDLAMVFQNYALYPHMTVRQNLGYALRVRRTPKAEIARRVEKVARLLRLEELLDRRPRALSGGQQQRVAMGRAIIREPAAFLMDEPLSNLDAKLRVGMRTSLQQLHSRLGTTTVYVTHDQVEAMTLGQRVAVMRDGHVLQVDVPQRLYEEPADLFVAAFIGSPSMNLAEATVEGDALELGRFRIPLDRERRPSSAPGGRVVVGIRPEAFEDAAFAGPGLPELDVRVEVLEELGSDAFVFFDAGATPVVIEEAVTVGEDEATLMDVGERSLFAARVDPRTAARVGQPLRLAVDPSRFHFFAAETGESLLARPTR